MLLGHMPHPSRLGFPKTLIGQSSRTTTDLESLEATRVPINNGAIAADSGGVKDISGDDKDWLTGLL